MGRLLQVNMNKVDHELVFSAEGSSSRIVLFAETPVYSALMFVLEPRRARSGRIAQQAASCVQICSRRMWSGEREQEPPASRR